MKTGKSIIFILASLLIVIGIQSSAVASPALGSNLTIDGLNPVTFYLVDNGTDPYDDNVMDVTTTLVYGSPSATLEYSFDGNSFNAWSNQFDIDLSPDHYKQIYFRLNTGSGFVTEADITFNTFEDVYFGLDAYQNIIIDWNYSDSSIRFELVASSSNDNFAAVPIPSAALLLGTGLIGLFSFRRRVFKA